MIINNIANINFGGGGGGETAKLQKKSMTLSSATATVVPDDGYDGMTKVDVDATEYGTSNYNDGVLAQKAKLTEINITENGTYTKEDGYSNVVVDVKAPTETIDLKTGIKIGNSTFSAMPYTLICDSGVTNMNSLFSNCRNLTTLDLSNFDTSNVTNMQNMFTNCEKLTTLDVSNFDTSKVFNMSDMFYSCKNLTTLDLSSFNTSKVNDMNTMFYDCNKLTILDLSNFDNSKIFSIYGMFKYCDLLTTVKVINCNEATKNKILTQLQSDLSSYTWTLGDDGIITRSEKTA